MKGYSTSPKKIANKNKNKQIGRKRKTEKKKKRILFFFGFLFIPFAIFVVFCCFANQKQKKIGFFWVLSTALGSL
jgi:phosphate/sulfate permease